MELDNLKPFVRMDVEVLVSGCLYQGTLAPIAKGIIVILPFPEDADLYGPVSMAYQDIKAIRVVKRKMPGATIPEPPENPPVYKSSFDSLPPNFRFPVKKPGM